MIRRMLGAPLGGTMRGGHQVFDPSRVSLIMPPNFGSGAGSRFPLTVVVELGNPSTPVVCWAFTTLAVKRQTKVNNPLSRSWRLGFFVFILPRLFSRSSRALV